MKLRTIIIDDEPDIVHALFGADDAKNIWRLKLFQFITIIKIKAVNEIEALKPELLFMT